MTAADNDDDTIPSKPLAADKCLRGMHKNSFLNGHKGALSTFVRQIESLCKGWKVRALRIFGPTLNRFSR